MFQLILLSVYLFPPLRGRFLWLHILQILVGWKYDVDAMPFWCHAALGKHTGVISQLQHKPRRVDSTSRTSSASETNKAFSLQEAATKCSSQVSAV